MHFGSFDRLISYLPTKYLPLFATRLLTLIIVFETCLAKCEAKLVSGLRASSSSSNSRRSLPIMHKYIIKKVDDESFELSFSDFSGIVDRHHKYFGSLCKGFGKLKKLDPKFCK